MRLDGTIAETYGDFATYAAGSSACFEQWARGVAEDPDVLAWLGTLPVPKRQPNLVFAAARWCGLAAPSSYDDLRSALLGDDGRIRATILGRATQTNEVGRLATLLPAFDVVAGGRPLSLLEVGASAGLCLYPDRWSYRWSTGADLVELGGAGPLLTADATGPVPFPAGVPQVVRRRGIDLNPLDVRDDDAMRWLLTLVWPEHDDRRRRLAEAIEIARADPPDIRRADLSTALPEVVAEELAALPADGALVVFHSAVIAYLDEARRAEFDGLMRSLVAADSRVHWVSNEGRQVLPQVSGSGPEAPSGRFVLGIDGRAVGHTEGHGRALHWW